MKDNFNEIYNNMEFGNESNFKFMINNTEINLIVGKEIYIETDDIIYWYNKDTNNFISEDNIPLLLLEEDKKIIESAINLKGE